MPEVGLEPTLLTEFDLKSNAATITPLGQTLANQPFAETWAGIEPAMRDLQSPELPLFYQVFRMLITRTFDSRSCTWKLYLDWTSKSIPTSSFIPKHLEKSAIKGILNLFSFFRP